MVYDLIIQETLLNGELYQAIKITKKIVHRVKKWLANPRRGGNVVSKLAQRTSDYQPFLNDVRGTGRLVKVLAILNQATLAITCKMEGVQGQSDRCRSKHGQRHPTFARLHQPY